MIAQHDPFVGQLRAANAPFDHVVGLSCVVHFDLHVHVHTLSTEVIFERQSALPIVGSQRAIQIGEQRLGIVPRKRQRHDLRDRNCFIDRDALRTGNGGPSRSERIARHHEVVGDRPALNVVLGAPGAVGTNLALFISVFGGIAVDEEGGRAFALGGERFESTIAVGVGVANQDDFTFNVDTLLA